MLLCISTKRHRKAAVYITLFCAFLGFWVVFRHGLSRNHYLLADLVGRSSRLESGTEAFLSPKEAVSVCRDHGFGVEAI